MFRVIILAGNEKINIKDNSKFHKLFINKSTRYDIQYDKVMDTITKEELKIPSNGRDVHVIRQGAKTLTIGQDEKTLTIEQGEKTIKIKLAL